MTLIV